MKAKEYLTQLKDVDDLILTINKELAFANAGIAPSGVPLTDSAGGSHTNSSPTERKGIKIGDLRSELEKTKADYVEIKLTATRLIRKIKNVNYQRVLYLYYLQNMTLNGTAEEMNRSYQNICALRNEALMEFQKLMDAEGIS